MDCSCGHWPVDVLSDCSEPSGRTAAPRGSHLGRFYLAIIRLAALADAELISVVLRNRRIREGDLTDFNWPAPLRLHITLPRAVTLTRLATALFVFIFGIGTIP